MTLDINEDLSFHASLSGDTLDFSHTEFTERVGTGFNEHGIRENRDETGELESVDVIFEAMKPGPPERRNGVRITSGFLDKVGRGDYTGTPHIKDHERQNTFSKIGQVQTAWYSDRLDSLILMTRTPNIDGSKNHQEAIARYTHNPPEITDGSLGFATNFEVEMNEEDEPEMVDGRFVEFSTTNFPGGYDDGGVGVNAAFSKAVSEFSEQESTYKFSVGDWAERSWQGGTVMMKLRDRTKGCATADGNEVCGDEGEPVYKGEQWEDGEFTGQMIAAAQGSLSSTEAPQDMSATVAHLRMNFESDEGELDEVYSDWSDEVNMTASQLESWADHACADTASQEPETVRERNLRLLETNKSDWDSDDISDAKRTISFISRMRGQKPDSPKEGGEGSCPSEWAVSLLNWAYNPFDSMPDGTPDPEEEQDNSISTDTIEFEGGLEEIEPSPQQLERVYERWTSMVNMTEGQMEAWEHHPCSDVGVDNGEGHRDNFMMLMGQPPEQWSQQNVEIANRAVAFMSEQMEMDPENPESGGPGTCPSRWAVGLLNRGHNPFDSFPSGNPEFSKDGASTDIQTKTITINE